MTTFKHHPDFSLFAIDQGPLTVSIYLEDGAPVVEIDKDQPGGSDFVRGKPLPEAFQAAVEEVAKNTGTPVSHWSIELASGQVIDKDSPEFEATAMAALSAPRTFKNSLPY